MKKISILLMISAVLLSCEDVIEVETPTEEPRLIINALIRVDKSQQFIPVAVKVTETNNFFEETPVTQLEQAIIFYGTPNPDAPEILENGGSSSLAEVDPGSGIYVPDPTFDDDQRIQTQFAEPGIDFQLIITHKGRRYFGQTSYAPVVPFDNIEQGDSNLFGDDDTELLITFTDPPSEANYYVFDFDYNEFLTLDDQFIDGQEFEFSYFYDKELDSGDQAEVSILGADQQFYNYMDLLVEQTQFDGGIFQIPVATVRGNMFDVTDLDNTDLFDNVEQPNVFPLGYFAVVQEFKQTVTIQ
ncbi:MAG: DUF4249 family protein [Croceitalea sp.]|nr:DUF4249 domain-containing protein [Croceitalea sp.]MBT8239136.1 DUF4249 domain-containing protein [Croceitalea sp.]NNL08575.1 DUF4249 family protein [Croceitalea sp.]NNM16987.1 DUF4249 family protein [Croceitalea sp.]